MRDMRSNNSGCKFCGNDQNHGSYNEREKNCPAFGKECKKCHIKNHFTHLCQSQTPNHTALSLIAHVNDVPGCNNIDSKSNTNEIFMSLLPHNSKHLSISAQVFPDSGATICLMGTKHLSCLNICKNNLTKCNKIVTTAGGYKLVCYGWIYVSFTIHDFSTKQKVYVCNDIERIYLSKAACIDLNILPNCFPFPMITSHSQDMVSHITVAAAQKPLLRTPPPDRPVQLPFPPTPQNVEKLEH